MAGFVKICGMNDTRAVEAALAAGADAIGFVFAKSVRQVTPEQAEVLSRPARGKALCVAVTLHPASELVEAIFEVFKPDVLQTDAADFARIMLPSRMKAWPVWRDVPADDAVAALRRDQRLLFEGPKSGTGQVADWGAARQLAARCELVLAGGLAPGNVQQAIASVRPFGVDVSSGVEELPGRKDPALIESFVDRARQAFARLDSGEQ